MNISTQVIVGQTSGSTRDTIGYSNPSISTYTTRGRPVAGGTVLIVPGLSTRVQEIMSRYEVSGLYSAHDPVTKIAPHGGGGGTRTVVREVHGHNGGIYRLSAFPPDISFIPLRTFAVGDRTPCMVHGSKGRGRGIDFV